MERSRGSSFTPQEDELLCRVYLEISQDPIDSNNQSLRKLWEKIKVSFNEKKIDSWEIRSNKSLECRMGTILYAVRNVKSCIIQVENMHPSGASEDDIMERAKKLLVQDPKLKKGFKFDHVWVLLKDIPKFTDNVNISIPNTSSMSDCNGSPASQSPRMSSFSISLSSEDGGSNSSQRPIGSKKAKLKRKIAEGNNNSSFETLAASTQEAVNFLKENVTSRNKTYEMAKLRMQNQAKKLVLKEMEEENKILLTDLNSIVDSNTREFIRSEQRKIVQKRTQEQQQPPPNVPSSYEQYFADLRSPGSNLPGY